MEESSKRNVIFITINSKGDDRDENEIRRVWERAVKDALAPGIEDVEKVTVLSAPSQSSESPPAEPRPEPKLSLTIRTQERHPPRFYYTFDDVEWFEIPGALSKVWQLWFDPRDLGLAGGSVKVRVDFGEERVDSWIKIKSAGKHVLEMTEP